MKITAHAPGLFSFNERLQSPFIYQSVTRLLHPAPAPVLSSPEPRHEPRLTYAIFSYVVRPVLPRSFTLSKCRWLSSLKGPPPTPSRPALRRSRKAGGR